MNGAADVRGRRLAALALDWLIWTYLPAAVLYYLRRPLAELPYLTWLYTGTVGFGLLVAVTLQSLGTSIGERVTGLAGAPTEGELGRRVPWYRTQVGWTALCLGLVTFVLGWRITEINLYYVFTRADRMQNMTERLVRPYWPVFGLLAEKMIETIFLALMSTLFAIPLAVLVSFFAARNLMMRLTMPWGRAMAGLVAGLAGAWLGVRLAGVMFQPLRGSGLDVALLTGIATPFLGLLGLLGFALLGARFLDSAIARGSSAIAHVLSLSLGAMLGVGTAYLATSLVAMVVYAGSWVLLVRDYAPWPWAVLGLGSLAGAAYASRQRLDGEFPVGQVVYALVRFVLNITRSIEPFVWALIFVTWFRLGPFPGMVALMVHSVASLGKLYSEQIENIDPGPLEAIRATGANELQTIAYAVVPQIVPPYISFTIYRWDINVRMSTIIGLVGGGGIGQMLFQYQNLGQWRSVSVAVILIVAVVMVLDMLSARIRERIV